MTRTFSNALAVTVVRAYGLDSVTIVSEKEK